MAKGLLCSIVVLRVIGQKTAKLVLSLKSLVVRTIAGRRPDCSCPAWGLKSIHTASPRSGTLVNSTILHRQLEVQHQSHHEGYLL